MKKLIIPILFTGVLALTGCAKVDSFQKTWESDTKGLQRDIEVYSVTGEKLAEYQGEKVRVESENETNKISVMIDGKRMSFYNATVIIEEK